MNLTHVVCFVQLALTVGSEVFDNVIHWAMFLLVWQVAE